MSSDVAGRFCPYCLLLLAGCIFLPYSDVDGGEMVDYLRDVKPILGKRCYACHGPLKQEAGLRLDSASSILRGSESGTIVERGDVAASLILELLTGEEGTRMPPEGEGSPVPPREIEVIKTWIQQGAPSPDEEEVLDPRNHWSYQPPRQQQVPTGPNSEWIRNPIDAFVSAKHSQLGLNPSAPMDKSRLLRRVYFDLIGLPPTLEQLKSFLSDTSDEAYDRIVDDLLMSPQYGERWGRHWMDIWRYSDWYGQRQFNLLWFGQRNLWQWRDWIVDSLNEDKGYDRMIIEMLAADEVAPDDADALRATGFIGRNYSAQSRNAWLQHTVEFTSQGLLALTMKCARCHDHKYDPISQQDYYRFRALFEPHSVRTTNLPGRAGVSRIYDAYLTRPTYVLLRGDENNPQEDNPLSPSVPPALGGNLTVEEVAFDLETHYPAMQVETQTATMRRLKEKVHQASTTVEKLRGQTEADVETAKLRLDQATTELESYASRLDAERAKYADVSAEEWRELAIVANQTERKAIYASAVVAVIDAQAKLDEATTNVEREPDREILKLRAKNARKKLDETRDRLKKARDELDAEPSEKYQPLGRIYPKHSTGRRRALAKWMTNPSNPRTSRVAVNHVWLRHFGTPLVESVDNFGPSGNAPSNLELLDWLSVEFTKQNWSMKWLHRLVVTSATYRMQSSNGSEQNTNVRIDPENKFLWRMNSRRMEAEAVRDSLLHLARRLDPKMGGPELDPKEADTNRRRSVYFRTTPNHKADFLDIFDFASPNQCYRRESSVLPQQAFALRNSDLAVSMARLIARELVQRVGDENDRAFIQDAFNLMLCRPPSLEERAASMRFLDGQRALLSDPDGLTKYAMGEDRSVAPSEEPALRAKENLVRVLVNHNDFVTVR